MVILIPYLTKKLKAFEKKTTFLGTPGTYTRKNNKAVTTDRYTREHFGAFGAFGIWGKALRTTTTTRKTAQCKVTCTLCGTT